MLAVTSAICVLVMIAAAVFILFLVRRRRTKALLQLNR
jgi:hypothetical protein